MDKPTTIENYLDARRRWFAGWLDSRGHSVPDRVFRKAADFYAAYAAAEHELGERPRGLLVLGNIGSGKTTLCEDLVLALRRISREQVIVFRARRMAEDFATFPDYVAYLRQKNHAAIFLDDLGSERISCRFGVQWSLADYLDDRYIAWREHRFPTIITTNLTGLKEIAERYGARAASRIREMVTPLVYRHDDRRPAW